MKSVLTASRDLLVPFFLMGFLVLACQTQESKTEKSLSFSKQFDSLSRYDSLVIEIKDLDGKTLGTIYHDKPTAAGQLDNLSVPDWDGGPIDIIITGYLKGHDGPVYQTKKRYDGKSDTATAVVLIDPNPPATPPTRLTLAPDTLRLAAHGAPGRFTTLIEPSAADPGIDWRLSDSTIAALRPDGGFIGLARGAVKVWATSRLKPEVGDTAWIIVTETARVSSVRFLRDSLSLFVGGAPESLQVEVLPSLANPEVGFTLSDSSLASLAGRLLSPKAAGRFTVIARSLEDSSKWAALPVSVREPVRIEGVAVVDTAVLLYLGGPGRTLTAKVLPADFLQDVRWKSLSPAIVSADARTGAISPLLAGSAKIVATSVADSTKRDTVEVAVKIDAPRLTITADSVISAGAEAAFHVHAAQEFGQINLFQWDLDGDGAWDDSVTGPWTGASVDLPTATARYDMAGPATARFRVRDGEGNVTLGAYSLRVVGNPVVSIEAPKNNSYTNQKRIQVDWSVNGVSQDSLRSQDLAIGPNAIVRYAIDSAGKMFTTAITVTLDTTAPLKPAVSGSSPTNVKPKWSWTSGGGGGSGEYRFRLGDAAFPADAPVTRDLAYTMDQAPVSGTTYALYVEERDLAGNWSPPANLPIRYDITAPTVAIASPQTSGTYFTSAGSVTLSGTATGPEAISQVKYKVGNGAPVKAAFVAGSWTTAAIPLDEGSSVPVTVTAFDEAGNSAEAALEILMDATAPSAPAVSVAPPAEINVLQGDFAWTAGGDGAAGSGLNGHYRYSIGGGPWKDTTAAVLANLPLKEGTNLFAVQEQDRAQLWSASATRSVRVDTAGPVIALTGPSNIANYKSLLITLSGQVKDTGTAVMAMTVSGQQSGSGTVSITADAWTSAALTLKSGSNSLLLTATDRVGNSRTLPVTVNVNVPAPVVVITDPNDSLTLTRSDMITVSYTIDSGAVQTQNFTLTEGVNRLIVATAANASGHIGSDTVKVTKDATAPNAPLVTRGATPTKNPASWTWNSAGDNPGGAGLPNPHVYRYSLDGGVTWTLTGTPQATQAAEGTWTLIVQEQDKAGNWSASSPGRTIVVDKTPPVVAITGPEANYVTSERYVTLYYKVDNDNTSLSTICDLGTSDGAKSCSASATDDADNTGTSTRTFYHRAKAIFVTPGGAGTKSGKDWQNALDSLALSDTLRDPASEGREFWIGSGTFYVNLRIAYSTTLYGGFDVSKLPYDTAGRDKHGTRLGGYMQVTPDGTSMTVTLDDLILEAMSATSLGNTVNLNNVTLDRQFQTWSYGLELLNEVVVNANNLTVDRTSYDASILYVGGTFNMNGGAITNNLTYYQGVVEITGTMNMTNGAAISGNLSTQYQLPAYQAHLTGKLSIGTGVSFTCDAPSIFNDGGVCDKAP